MSTSTLYNTKLRWKLCLKKLSQLWKRMYRKSCVSNAIELLKDSNCLDVIHTFDVAAQQRHRKEQQWWKNSLCKFQKSPLCLYNSLLGMFSTYIIMTGKKKNVCNIKRFVRSSSSSKAHIINYANYQLLLVSHHNCEINKR